MEKTKQQKAKDFIINNGVIIVMFILVIYTGLTSDNFLTRNNLMNILMNMSSRLVIALGIAGCVITAGCDLSAGRMIGFAACIAGMLLQRLDYSGKFFPDMKPLNVVLVAIIAMLICAAFGTVTGIFIAYLNVPPFIATLAMMEIVYGICCIYGDRRFVPCICRRITPCGEDGRCALCDWSGIFCGESIRKAFSERGKMAVCRTGRLYAAGIVSGNICKYGFPGAFIHGDDPVFLVLLSGSERLELQKFDPSGCWNGSLCTVLL